MPQAVAILNRYADRDPAPGARVFPIIDGHRLSTAENVHAAISRANALANKYLEKIAAQSSIKRPSCFTCPGIVWRTTCNARAGMSTVFLRCWVMPR
ncbi:MAG TPA: hypothetical protein VFG50_13865 [Rhodothermales bacterium]|nr:hypothetical protein [Rhodothermales bacterium]